MKNVLSNKVLQVLEYGSMAPSGHNTQPWGIKPVSENEFILLSQKDRWLSQVDPENRELLITMGAFWENVERSAQAMGMQVESKILAESPQDSQILQFKLSSGEETNEHILEIIERRSFNRHPYDKQPLDPIVISEIEANPYQSFIQRDDDKGEWLVESLEQANEKQSANDAKQEELSNWLRFSRSEVKEKLDGLSPEMLALPTVIRLLWYTFYNRKSAMSKSFRNAGVNNAHKQANHCAGFVIISSEDGSIPQLLRVGRNLQSLALNFTEKDISLHPMSQVLEETPWKDEIKEKLDLENQPQMVVRSGYSSLNHKTSLRRKVEDFMQP
jgi:hypothetical protein